MKKENIFYGKGKTYGKTGRRTRNEESRKDEHFGWRGNTAELIQLSFIISEGQTTWWIA